MKKCFSFCFLLFVFFIHVPAFAQVQKGQNITGNSGDHLGWSVSMPNENTIAIGTFPPFYNIEGITRIYAWNGTTWTQKGADILGEDSIDFSGYAVSMPNSNTVAIGAPLYGNAASASYDTGHVRIFAWDGNTWAQKGNSILGEAAEDNAGTAVDMPDSNTVAVGSPNNDGNGTDAGHVRVFTWNGNSWVQKGNNIEGEAAGDNFGGAISMPDVNTIAIGAARNDDNGADAGHTRVFIWNGTAWVQKGNDIDGESTLDNSGKSVSMPNANTIAIGAPYNGGNGASSGHTRIYQWNGLAWVQKGNDIDGDTIGGYFGMAVSMPSPNVLAVGAMGYDNLKGKVKVYRWDGTSWTQQINDIVGQLSGFYCGANVSMPNENTVGLGEYCGLLYYSPTYNTGQARVFSLCTTSPTSTLNVTVCDSFTSPSSNHVWTTSGTYQDTLTSFNACDSIIAVNLTVNSSHITDTIYACNSYTWIDGNTYTASNNTASVTYTNALGCDSTINLNLIIQTPFYNLTDTVVACDSYTWANGTTYTGANSVILDTLNSLGGCDSVVTLHLTLLNSTGSTTTAQACNSYTWIDGNTYTASDDSITYVLTNAVGCDSVIRLDLTIDTLIASTDYVNATTLEGSILGNYEHYEWVECQGTVYPSVAADSSLIFTPDYNGAYALMVFNNSGCIDTSDCKTITVTGVETIEGEETFTLYPNPNNGQFIIDFGQTFNDITFSIYTVSGQLVYLQNASSAQQMSIEFNGAEGIYIGQFSTANGHYNRTKFIIN